MAGFEFPFGILFLFFPVLTFILNRPTWALPIVTGQPLLVKCFFFLSYSPMRGPVSPPTFLTRFAPQRAISLNVSCLLFRRPFPVWQVLFYCFFAKFSWFLISCIFSLEVCVVQSAGLFFFPSIRFSDTGRVFFWSRALFNFDRFT